MIRFTLGCIILVCLFIASCETTVTNNQADETSDQYFHEVIEFQYKGHDYIRFSKNIGAHSSSTGVVHNPDCKKCINVYD